MKDTQIMGQIKKIVWVAIVIFFLIIIGFIFMQNQSGKKQREEILLINFFGKQRMYSQQISKDASRIYVLQNAIDSGLSDPSLEENKTKLIEIKNNFQTARKHFSHNLEAMNEGHLLIDSYPIHLENEMKEANSYLKEINLLWAEFELAIDTLLSASNGTDMYEAAQFINNHNMELLGLIDTISEKIHEELFKSNKNIQRIIYLLIILLSITTIFIAGHFVKYIMLPFKHLYQGISEIGLDKETFDKKETMHKNIAPMVTEIGAMFQKINNLISLIENINNNDSFMDTLNFINNTFSAYVPYNYIGIALIEEDKKLLKASFGVSDGSITGMPENLLGYSWPIRETILGHLLETGQAHIINDLEEYTSGKPKKIYNEILLKSGIRASISLPLFVSGKPVGVIFFSSKTKNAYHNEHLKFLRTLANSIAISLDRNIFINDIMYSSILALAKLAETRDEDTGEHLERMKKYSRKIAELLYNHNIYTSEINFEYMDKIERFSPLHDIGKVGIRDEILRKPGKLTASEYEEMKRHAAYGAEVLRTAEENLLKKGKSLFDMGIEIAEGHHEKCDGSGYPKGKKGLEIPLSARIVAVADVFDALTSRRPYKEAFTLDRSFEILKEGRGKHFDPVIVDVFLENRDVIEKMYHKFAQNEASNENMVI